MFCIFRSTSVVKKDFFSLSQEMGKKAIKSFTATTLERGKVRTER